MSVVIGICGIDLIGQRTVRQDDLKLSVRVEKIPVRELVQPSEHLVRISPVNDRIGIVEIGVVIQLRIDAAVVVLFPIQVMVQVICRIRSGLKDREADIRIRDPDPGVNLRVGFLQGYEIRVPRFIQEILRLPARFLLLLCLLRRRF